MSTDLYNAQMLAWSEQDDHAGSMADFDAEATLSNPLCGDRVTIRLKMDADRIADLRYQVRGCLLCKAACAHMAELVRGWINRTQSAQRRIRTFFTIGAR